jgi:hypothetical protein
MTIVPLTTPKPTIAGHGLPISSVIDTVSSDQGVTLSNTADLAKALPQHLFAPMAKTACRAAVHALVKHRQQERRR